MNENIDSSNEMQNKLNKQLIEYNDKQNELIFSTRKRIYILEKIQKRDVLFLLGMNFLICTLCILVAVEFGGFKW